MARRATTSHRKHSLTIVITIVARADSSFVSIDTDPGDTDAILGHTHGTLGIRVGTRDLVGLTAPRASLKALHHVVRTLEHLVKDSGTAGGPGAPGGGHGGGSRRAYQTFLEPSDADCRSLVISPGMIPYEQAATLNL